MLYRGRWLLVSAISVAASMPTCRAEPPAPPSAEGRAQLVERDRLDLEARRLSADGKFAEAIAVVEKALAIETEVLGETCMDAFQSIQWLVRLNAHAEHFGK